MRWETLFADMDAQLEAARRAELRADVADLVRAERATVHLADRLRASTGRRVRLRVGSEPVEGELVDAAEQWVLIATGGERRVLVPVRAIVAVGDLGPHVAPDPGQVERRLTLGHALRSLARDRATVLVRTGDVELGGLVGAVGADHLDVVVPGQAPWTVPFASLVWVRSS